MARGMLAAGVVAGVVCVAALSGTVEAQTVRAQRVSSASFNRPILVTQPEGVHDRLWVVEQPGTIRVMNAATGAVEPTPFLTVPSVRYGGEGGLLGMAFHPQYASNGYFYLYYNRVASPTDQRVIVRYRVSAANPNIADPDSAATIWAYTASTGNHNGGWIAFAPNDPDGNLFIAWGERGVSTNAPDITDNALGKIHRLDVDGLDNIPGNADDDQFPADANKHYAIPSDNPFVNVEGDDEIWAYGLRNPWRCSFDRLTGELYIGDVGAGVWEEINVAPAPPAAAGRNYGWNCMEGFFCNGSTTSTSCACNNPSLVPPAYAYLSGGTSECAVSGGYVYRGCAMPWLHGKYLFGDYCSGKVWTSVYDGTLLTEITDITAQVWSGQPRPAIYSFGQDASGELYICGSNGGVYRLVSTDVASQCGCGTSDFNHDGDVGTDQDIEAFFACLGGTCPAGEDSDFNGDGDIGTDQDIEAFFRVLGGGWC
ncbi:MAG TPA: PQQ-dependent sugar dehydrogenase [Phycisphaerales bacterium]|nr:PQQ-dependent sugar dehydrogenase [Phycisphaerales bacterium]